MMILFVIVFFLSLLRTFLPPSFFSEAPSSRLYKRLFFLTVEVSELALIILVGRYSVLLLKGKILPGLGMGFLLGIGSLLLALYLTRLSFRATCRRASGLQYAPRYIVAKKLNVLRQLFITVKEELLWRATIQYLLGNTSLSVLVTAFLFTVIHFNPEKKPIVIMDYLELFFFALVLGVFFFYSENIYAVIAMHFVRNIGIVSIKQLSALSHDRS